MLRPFSSVLQENVHKQKVGSALNYLSSIVCFFFPRFPFSTYLSRSRSIFLFFRLFEVCPSMEWQLLRFPFPFIFICSTTRTTTAGSLTGFNVSKITFVFRMPKRTRRQLNIVGFLLFSFCFSFFLILHNIAKVYFG